MDSKITRLIEQASVIVGALPYLQAYRDKTFLIKFGGSAMDDARLVKKLMRDIVLLEVLGFNPVIVHGGGKAISKAMAEAGLEARFVNGLRVTTPEAISIVERTLSGTINPGLVQMFRDYGGKGVGIPGTEIFVGERIHEKDEQGNPIDIGEVGNVIGCLTERITEALELQITPIVSPLAKELGTHKPLNVNADLAAAALAKELKPVKLIYISDVPGIMKDPSDPSTLIKSVTRTEALDLIKDGTVSGGMIPKIHSAIDALNAGVRKVHFIDGRLPHTLLLEIFTPDGIGDGTFIPHLSYAGDSIIGSDVNFGAGTVCSNFRHDGGEHRMVAGGKLEFTGRNKLGAVIGDHVRLGANTVVLPGRVLPPGAWTRPGEVFTGA